MAAHCGQVEMVKAEEMVTEVETSHKVRNEAPKVCKKIPINKISQISLSGKFSIAATFLSVQKKKYKAMFRVATNLAIDLLQKSFFATENSFVLLRASAPLWLPCGHLCKKSNLEKLPLDS